MPITPQNIVRHELMFLPVRISQSSDPTHKNLRGKVVDETYHTLKIETSKGEKVIPKKKTVFIFTLPNGVKVKVEGRLLVGRPEDRVKKKFAQW